MRAAVAFVLAALLQVRVPPAASLDVQIPVSPVPVRMDGRVQLAYELHMTNFRPVDVALTGVDVFGDAPLASYHDAALRAVVVRAGVRPDGSDTRTIAPAGRAVVFVWLSLDPQTSVPSTLRHRVSFDVRAGAGSNVESGSIDAVAATVSRATPAALDPPLAGGPWAAVYDPDLNGGHRRAIFAIDGKARIPARFAIDWIKAESGNGYGADVLAVADAAVAAAVDGFAEPTTPISIENAAGNYVSLDLGGGRFAFYEHLKPGSVRVKPGDRVRSGQAIAQLGSSGSVSSGAHLHFHVADASSSLGAEGMPFVFKRFEQLGAYTSLAAFGRREPWVPAAVGSATRQLEMPLRQSVIRF